MAKQDVTVELFYSGVWNDHTADTLIRDQIQITRGRADESTQPAPDAMTLSFKGWDFNPRNAASPLFGLIGRNTPIRVAMPFRTRFIGEVASWTPRQSLGGPNQTPDRWVLVQAAGITRRLGQGQDPLHSVIFREVMSAGNAPFLVAYWPCEDGSQATQLASPMPGVDPMSYGPGAVTPASYDGFFGSEPIATIAAGNQPGVDSARGDIPSYSGDFFFRGLIAVPEAGITDQAQMVSVLFTGGSFTELELEYTFPGTGALRLRLFDEDGTLVDETASFDAQMNGDQALISVELTQDGADLDWLLFVRKVSPEGVVATGGAVSGTFTGVSRGTARDIHVGGTTTDGMSFGHIMVGNSQSLVFNISDVLNGHLGEHAGQRIARLCDEQGVTLDLTGVSGDLDDTLPMGPQRSDGFLALLRECADVDGGILQDEPGGFLSLEYRTRINLYNQVPGPSGGLALDYDAAEVAPPLEPVTDDQATRNDVTVTRPDGSSVQKVDQDGPLGVDTVGRYNTSVTVNVMSDGMLGDQAGWRLHLGTTDEVRWPQVTLDLSDNPDLATLVDIRTNLGDRITIANLPPGLTPDLANLLVQGWTEVIGSHTRRITFNCTPEGPYHIAEVEHADYGIIGSDRADLWFAFDAGTDTVMTVDPGDAASQQWVHEGDFDILVAGVRLTVTAIGPGAGILQEFTVTQTPVNGVTKVIPAGTPVDVFHKSYFGL